MVSRDRKYLRYDYFLAALIVSPGTNEIFLLVDNVDFVGQRLPDLLKHLDQRHRAELIKIVICGEELGQSINDYQIQRKACKNLGFDHFANRFSQRRSGC
jgi:hypothetical protein